MFNRHQRGAGRRSLFLALVVVAALLSVGAALATGTRGGSESGGNVLPNRYRAILLPVPHNPRADTGSTVLAVARLERMGDRRFQVRVVATGLSPKLPHAMHIHGVKEARNECPDASARTRGSSMPGSKRDGLIDVIEGLPDYGPILVSLTKSGDTSAASGLALDRFPVASAATAFKYERTIPVPGAVARHPQRFHVVIHGLDLNGDGAYNGRIGPLGGAPNEATLPVACGQIFPR